MQTHGDDDSELIPVASFETEGEAEVALAKLRAYGIEAALEDHIEGGALHVQGEPGVVVEVAEADADDAESLLGGDDETSA